MPYRKGLVKEAAKKFVKGLTPNRVTVYLTVLVNVTGAAVTTLAPLAPAQIGSVVAALAFINGVALMFLKGWQKFEQAMYDAESVQYQLNARAEQVAAASAPRSGVKLPR